MDKEYSALNMSLWQVALDATGEKGADYVTRGLLFAGAELLLAFASDLSKRGMTLSICKDGKPLTEAELRQLKFE